MKSVSSSVIGDAPLDLPAVLLAPVQALIAGKSIGTLLLYAAAAVALSAALSGCCFYVYRVCTIRCAETFTKNMRDRLFYHIQRLPLSWHSVNQTGDIVQRCTSDVDVIRSFIAGQLTEVFRIVFLIIFALSVMFAMNVTLSLIALAFIPIVVAYSFIFYRKISSRFRDADEAEGDLTADVQENLTGMRVVRAFGRERYEIEKFDKKNNYFAELWMRLGDVLSLFWGMGDFFSCLQVLFVITFIVLDVFYSLRDISYWGMIPALSSDSHERSTYTALGSFGGSIGYNGLTIVVIPIVTYFSYIFTGKHQESQSGWTCFAIIVAILGVLTVCSVAFGTKESTSTLRAKAEDNGGPLAAFKALAQNDQLLWVALSYLLYAIANVATTGVLMYMFKFILNNSAAYSIVGVVSVIAGIIMAPLYPILNKRIPRRYLYLGGMVLMVLGYLLFIVGTNNLAVVTVGLVFFYLPQTFIQMTAILSLTDSIEYGQLKNGKRNEAVTLSVRPMLDKIAGACSNGIVGAVAIAAGMIGDATAADMTAANIHTFKVCAFYVPLAVIILSGVVFLLKVKISEKMHADIVEQLETQLNEG